MTEGPGLHPQGVPGWSPKRLVHVITALGIGGTEQQLLRLATAWAGRGIDQHVVALGSLEGLADQYRAVPVRLTTLGGRSFGEIPRLIRSLRQILRRERPDAVLTWMYHANVLGGLAAWGLRRTPVVWNVRASRITRDVERAQTVVLARVAGRLARHFCRLIIFNSRTGAAWHQRWGYPSDRCVVVPNGICEALFRRNESARRAVRAVLGLSPQDFVVGMLARYAPIKGHRYFIEAIGALRAEWPACRGVSFVLGGAGVTFENQELVRQISPLRDYAPVVLAGEIRDTPAFYSALDAFTVPSVDEAFPNVLVEAMACEIPCVTTDVGDCRDIVGGTGLIVPPRDAHAIARAWMELLRQDELTRLARGGAARKRVVDRFSLESVSQLYLDAIGAIRAAQGGTEC